MKSKVVVTAATLVIVSLTITIMGLLATAQPPASARSPTLPLPPPERHGSSLAIYEPLVGINPTTFSLR
jgi:hypothetical protein